MISESVQLNNYQPDEDYQFNQIIQTLKKGSEQERSVGKIIKKLRKGLSLLDKIDHYIVLILGDTGSGKTTLAAFLSNIDLFVYKSEFGNKIDYLNKVEESSRKIGSSSVSSQTSIPQRFQGNGIEFLDTAGFNDSRGSGQRIANSFLINKLTKDKEIKFIFVMTGANLKEDISKNQALTKLLQSIFFMVKDTGINIKENSIIIISKAEKEIPVGDYQRFLKKVIEDYIEDLEKRKNDENFDKKQMIQFLQRMKSVKMLPFLKPDDNKVNLNYKSPNKDAILNELKNIRYYKSEQFRIPLSQDLIEKLKDLQSISQQQVKDCLSQIRSLFKTIIKDFNYLQYEEARQILQKTKNLLKSQPPNECYEQIIAFIDEFIRVCNQQQNTQVPQQVYGLLKMIDFFYSTIFKEILLEINIKEFDKSSFFSFNDANYEVKRIKDFLNNQEDLFKRDQEIVIISSQKENLIEELNDQKNEKDYLLQQQSDADRIIAQQLLQIENLQSEIKIQQGKVIKQDKLAQIIEIGKHVFDGLLDIKKK